MPLLARGHPVLRLCISLSLVGRLSMFCGSIDFLAGVAGVAGCLPAGAALPRAAHHTFRAVCSCAPAAVQLPPALPMRRCTKASWR